MIKKFKTLEAAEKDLWVMHPDDRYWAKAFRMLDPFFLRMVSPIPPGIYKYKTLAEADEDRKKWIHQD